MVFSGQLLLDLLGKGLLRDPAYKIVQQRAMQSWTEKVDFKELVLQDETIMALLSVEEIDQIFDLEFIQRMWIIYLNAAV